MPDCNVCLYNPVCMLWRESECQDACSHLTGGLYACPLYKPTADLVAVVRCERCMYSDTSISVVDGREILLCNYGIYRQFTADDHYCGHGIPKTEGGAGDDRTARQ